MKFIDVNGYLINLDLVELIKTNEGPAHGKYNVIFYFGNDNGITIDYKSHEAREDAIRQLKKQIDKLNGEN